MKLIHLPVHSHPPKNSELIPGRLRLYGGPCSGPQRDPRSRGPWGNANLQDYARGRWMKNLYLQLTSHHLLTLSNHALMPPIPSTSLVSPHLTFEKIRPHRPSPPPPVYCLHQPGARTAVHTNDCNHTVIALDNGKLQYYDKVRHERRAQTSAIFSLPDLLIYYSPSPLNCPGRPGRGEVRTQVLRVVYLLYERRWPAHCQGNVIRSSSLLPHPPPP